MDRNYPTPPPATHAALAVADAPDTKPLAAQIAEAQLGIANVLRWLTAESARLTAALAAGGVPWPAHENVRRGALNLGKFAAEALRDARDCLQTAANALPEADHAQ